MKCYNINSYYVTLNIYLESLICPETRNLIAEGKQILYFSQVSNSEHTVVINAMRIKINLQLIPDYIPYHKPCLLCRDSSNYQHLG